MLKGKQRKIQRKVYAFGSFHDLCGTEYKTKTVDGCNPSEVQMP